jgi:hypothetical protein
VGATLSRLLAVTGVVLFGVAAAGCGGGTQVNAASPQAQDLPVDTVVPAVRTTTTSELRRISPTTTAVKAAAYTPPVYSYPTTVATSAGPACHPSYTPCIPEGSDDVDCAGGTGDGPRYVQGPVQVHGTDEYRLDTDHDGVGCAG